MVLHEVLVRVMADYEVPDPEVADVRSQSPHQLPAHDLGAAAPAFPTQLDPQDRIGVCIKFGRRWHAQSRVSNLDVDGKVSFRVRQLLGKLGEVRRDSVSARGSK
jgi:hypothetical protein